MQQVEAGGPRQLRHFRQILLWPLQLMPLREDSQIQNHWEVLGQPGPDNPWRLVDDEFTDEPAGFQERHYSEFVTFLPHVQRFLYGDGKAPGVPQRDSPIRVYRRRDIAQVRCTYSDPATPPRTFEVAHVDLYFFYDIDVVILTVEVHGDDLPLACAQETLFRLGRAYPVYWEANGEGGHCLKLAEWLAADGEVLAVSDYERREKFLAHVSQYRAPTLAAHWEYLLRPMVQHHSGDKGQLRYRQLEYHRLPTMAYLAFEDDPRSLSPADFVRLALISPPGESNKMPCAVRDFEQRYCYDRYWVSAEEGPPGTRYLCCGEAFVMLGSAHQPYFFKPGGSLLEQFRHQYFLLFLTVHLHKAALFMLADRLVYALKCLDIQNPESVKIFKREIRGKREIFLRFTHRYWFHHVSDQVQAKELFQMAKGFLGTEDLYGEVRERIQDMDQYLESDSLRRQANTVVRLTVLTAFGLIGTTVTGYFGMNILDLDRLSVPAKLLYFVSVVGAAGGLTFYTMTKSKGLSDFMDLLSDERQTLGSKLAGFRAVWRRKKA